MCLLEFSEGTLYMYVTCYCCCLVTKSYLTVLQHHGL